MQSLTGPERETIVTTCDADDHLEIWSAQRPIITKLKKNAAATLVDEGFHGKTPWASFTLPAELLSFRSTKIKRELTDEQRKAMGERLRSNKASLSATTR